MVEGSGILALQFSVLLFLLMLSAFFSGSEAALFSLNKIQIKSIEKRNKVKGARIAKLLLSPSRALITILFSNTLVNIAATSLTTSVAIKLLGSRGVEIAIVIMTFLVIIWGEIVPKSIAVQYAGGISGWVAGPLDFLAWLLTPIRSILHVITENIVKVLRGNIPERNLMTQAELETIVEVGGREGVIKDNERRMIRHIFQFGDKIAREVMTPRVDMICLKADSTLKEALEVLRSSKHRRLPVYKDSMDNMIGFLYVKDLFTHLKDKDLDIKITRIIRPIYYIPDSKKVDSLLAEFQRNKIEIVIVVDEYGGTAGLITLEDLMEEIVGEIQGEYDEEFSFKVLSEGSYLVDAKLNVDMIEELFNLNLADETISGVEDRDFDTIGGLIYDFLGRVPREGEDIKLTGIILRVEKMDGNRISQVRITMERELI